MSVVLVLVGLAVALVVALGALGLVVMAEQRDRNAAAAEADRAWRRFWFEDSQRARPDDPEWGDEL